MLVYDANYDFGRHSNCVVRLGFVGGMQVNKSPQSNAVSGVSSGPVQQQTNPSTNNTATPQGMPSSSNNNQQAGPQTNAGTPNTNMNNS